MDTNAIINDLKKSSVGYQTPSIPEGGSSVASNLSPLVPQQLYNRVKAHGGEHSPFIGEGGLAALNRATYEKVAVQIRYLAERREITDQAMHVALNGPSPDALAEETTRGTEVLLRRVEKELFHADNSVNPLAWNGIVQQISAGGNTSDLRGKAATPNYLQEVLGELYSAPRYGMASHILVTPRVLSELIKQSVTYGRHDQVQLSNGRLDYGSNQITISAPYGSVPVIACPFLEREDRVAPPAGSSSMFEGSMGTSAISSQPAAQADNASQFVAADEGAYIYRVVPVGSQGLGVAFDTAAVSVSAGDKVSFTISQSDASATISHYRIYRSAPDAGTADGALFVGEIANAGANTTFDDLNERVAGGSEIIFLNNRPDHLTYFQMMSLVRRPLAQVRASYPFMLMMFGAPAVLNPTKMWVVKNAGSNPAQGLG